jgi:hypothetical protein
MRDARRTTYGRSTNCRSVPFQSHQIRFKSFVLPARRQDEDLRRACQPLATLTYSGRRRSDVVRYARQHGGIPFTRGPLAHLLRNRFYIGEVAFKGEILKGEQFPILDRDLFEAVQAKLREQQTITQPKECSPTLCSQAPFLTTARIA